ncbi:hypothetical protein HFP57_16525 [Parasphingopyxis algicola]|uniref:LuxR C-terminal-related transcriptional regulator n=1 Tax=Parasphingopyxis algicola TaxID=2026624 RepID=UPI0015A2B076|nr:LuxR C-terminal-related transcriptional regulator [Parasphingopyxis algicola]QLC26477.1 hypothetical protein HFP57_16525 [Parasphingopyxis algicola]
MAASLHSARCSIVHAPAGYGKTSLLETFARLSKVPCVCYKASQFAGHVTLLDLMAKAPSDHILLLDEPHAFIADFADPGLLTRVLESRSGSAVIAARDLFNLPIARLRMEGGVQLIGVDELRIERKQIIRQCQGAVGRAAAIKIAHWAQGWPAAVRTLTDWLARPRNRLDKRGQFIAQSGIGAYIEQEVLSDLPADWVRALMMTSLLDGCSSEMLNAVSPDDVLGTLLPDIAMRLEGLVIWKEDELHVYPLLKQHLQRRFDMLPRIDRQAIMAHASLACDAAGRIPEAASLAIQSGGGSASSEYLRRAQGLKLWVTGGFDVIKLLVDRAAPLELAEEPRFRLLQCVIHLKEGRIAEAEALLAESLPLLEGDPDGLRDAEVIRTTILIYGCRAASESDLEPFNRIVLRNNDDPAWKAYITTLRCILRTQSGDLDRALGYFAEAVGYSRDAGSDYNLMFLDIHRANIELARGEIATARAMLKGAQRSFRKKFPKDAGVETVLHAITAYLEFETGRLSSARSHLRKSAHRMPQSEAWFDVYSAAYEPYARLLAAEIGLSSTLAALDAQKEQLRAQDLGRVADFVRDVGNCLSGEAWLRGEDGTEPPTAVNVPDAVVAWQASELIALSNGYALLAAGETKEACARLDEFVERSAQRKLRRSELRGLLLLVAAHDRIGESDAADRRFERALGIGSRHGFSRAFAEFGGDPVASRIRARLDEPPGQDDHAKLFGSLRRWFGDQETRVNGAVFTPREREVLDALEQGGSDKVVGRRLGISEHGVRFHLKNIYRKLRVHDRVDALAKAKHAEPH